MRMRRGLMLAIWVGFWFSCIGTLRSEVICGKKRPLKPVHCVCGKLIDPIGGPLPGALIRLSRDGADVASGSTDADGKFLFRELKSGKYELGADFDGFEPFRSPIVLTKPAKKCRHELVIRMVLVYPDNCGSYVMKR